MNILENGFKILVVVFMVTVFGVLFDIVSIKNDPQPAADTKLITPTTVAATSAALSDTQLTTEVFIPIGNTSSTIIMRAKHVTSNHYNCEVHIPYGFIKTNATVVRDGGTLHYFVEVMETRSPLEYRKGDAREYISHLVKLDYSLILNSAPTSFTFIQERPKL